MSIVAVVASFGLAVFLLITSGTQWWLTVAVAILGIVLLVFTARRGRHTSWAETQEHVGPEHAVVFWKPGCMFCERLLRAVGKDERVTWVNVRVDKQANAEVRRLNNGDELTPTVLVGERVLRNPSAEEMLESMSA